MSASLCICFCVLFSVSVSVSICICMSPQTIIFYLFHPACVCLNPSNSPRQSVSVYRSIWLWISASVSPFFYFSVLHLLSCLSLPSAFSLLHCSILIPLLLLLLLLLLRSLHPFPGRLF